MKRARWAALAAAVLIAPAAIVSAASAAPSLADCEALVKTSDGVSGTELYRYQKCRFDRLEEQVSQITTPTQEPSATPTPTVTPSATPSSSATPTATPPPTSTPTPTPTSTAGTGAALLDLPRVPWHGGNAYYRQFSKATNFSRADYFPIGIFYGNSETQDQANWDQDHGIRWHVEGGQRALAGDFSSEICFTSDELVGRDSDRARVEQTMRDDIAACTAAGRIPYTNHTGQVTSDYGATNNAYFRKLINLGGVQSADGYYYTDGSCDNPARADYQIGASDNEHCDSAANYGNFIRNFRARDDDPRQPIFGFVENGAPIAGRDDYITPAQLDGAVWSSITNGAGGIIYFNNSFGGACQSSQVLRDAQYGKTAGGRNCYGAIAEQMKATNGAVQALAPVLNTQSYVWDFGVPARGAQGTDTMLKAKDGYAYVFASVGINGDPGQRTFTLPAGLTGTAEVLGENRTVALSGGKLTDNFAAESTSHRYKIKIT